MLFQNVYYEKLVLRDLKICSENFVSKKF